MCKGQLLFYLLHVYFLRERCSLSKAWDHPGQWNSLETDGHVRWVSLGTSCLTSQEIGWELQSHCTTVPEDSNFSTHKSPEGKRVDLQSLSYLPFQGPCFSAWIPLFLFIPWSPNHQQAPVIVHRPTLKPACGIENPSLFQVSVVTTFITHKRDREPQLSTEPLVFTLLYLFVYWFCHSSHWSPGGSGGRCSLLHGACKHSSFARKSHQV